MTTTAGTRGRLLALAALGLWLATVAAAPPTTAPDPTRTAHKVFQDSEFWWKRIEKVQSPNPSWFERLAKMLWDAVVYVIQKIVELLRWILEKLFGKTLGDWSAGTPLTWLVAALALAWAGWKLYPLLRQWLQRKPGAVGKSTGIEVHQLPEAVHLYRQAGQALAAGRYAEAIRLGLLALLARLQQQGLLRYDPARTNREYQADLRTVPNLATLLGEVARPYERVWYGRFPASHDQAQQLLERCRPVVTEEGALS